MNATLNPPSTATKPARMVSLDQFRGYSVAAMFIVNFIGSLSVTHHVLKHNNTHFSYADSIMPSFLMICGLTYRMSYLKRIAQVGVTAARQSIVRRSLGLIWLSLMLTAFNSGFGSWEKMTGAAVLNWLAELLKANLWEVLAIIGAVQILILPIIGQSLRFRFWSVIGLGVLHVFLSWSFNAEFVYGRPNWLNAYFGAATKRAWDGGLFGLISWAEIMLIGSLAYDVLQRWPVMGAVRTLILSGLGMMIAGYGMSCLTRLYDVSYAAQRGQVERLMDKDGFARSPVLPDLSQIQERPWRELLAEPPFVPPPPTTERAINYWRMDKRFVTQSFVLFSSGMAVALFGLFVIACDLQGKSLGLFRTFGQNPLAAYIIHHVVAVAFWAIVPKDSPLLLVLFGLGLYFATTYLFVRFLEQRQLFLRL